MRTAAPPCAWLALGCALIASCTASGEDVRPPQDQLFFPSGLAVAGNVLFVANSNSELRYDSGAISVIDLGIVDSVISDWLSPAKVTGSCVPDPDHRETLVCDEAMFINKGAGVRIGNFATDIAVQDFSTPGGGVQQRVIVPTRGDPSISWADYDGTRLSCGTGTAAFAVCDAAHRLSSLRNDPDDFPILDEPFSVFAAADAGAGSGFAMVTHLIAGAVSLIDAPKDGPVQISDVVTGVFLAPPNVEPGATGVAGRPGVNGGLVYVGSRTESRIQMFTVGRPGNDPVPYMLPASYFFLDGVGENTGGSNETRGMQFSQDGNRLYVVNRQPPSLQIFDTSLVPSGVPRNAPTGASDICRQASTVAVFEHDVDGERAYVTCFQDGELYVVDPRGQSQVEDIVTVGRGPYSVVAAKDRKRLFISNFLEDTIAVIDVDPQSPTRNRVVLRIGEPRAP